MKKPSKSKSHMVSGNAALHGMRIDGLPVRDAKRGLTLEVTEDDIRHSNPQDPAGCAAAVAVMRQEGVAKALVHLSKVYIKRKTFWERFESPRSLRTEVVVFDRKGEFAPEEFELKAPHLSSTSEARREHWQRNKDKYKLQVPGGKNALPKKSTHKDYGPYEKGTGSRRRQHIVANVRGRPSGFTK